MNYKDVIQQLKKREFRPVYFLHGDEPFYIDTITHFFEDKILSETEKAFNYTVLYGKDIDFKDVVDNARRFPMMSDYQLVIIKEAQEMKSIAELQTYIEKPQPTTILVLCHKHKKLDARTKFAKAIMQHAFVFESSKLYDNQLPEWIIGYLKDLKLSIKPEAADLMAEYLGNDLGKIANEIDKISLNVPENTLITAEHIEKYVGISKEYNIFELTKALSTRDVSKCNKIVHFLNNNAKKNPLVVTIGTLYSFFSKVYGLHFLTGKNDKEAAAALGLRSEWALKEYKTATKNFSYQKTTQIIHYLHQYDMRSKGMNNVNTSDEELLKELIFKILH
jgi:DNA polymerase III subunit delta